MKRHRSRSLNWMAALALLALMWTPPAARPSTDPQDGQWQRYAEEEGIVGCERPVQRSKYIETRAEGPIDAPIEVLLEILTDIPSYPRWMHKCKEAALLEKKNDWHRVLYFVQAVPLGGADQDAVIEALTQIDIAGGRIVSVLRSIENSYRPAGGESRKRMIEFSGKWELRMIDRKRTQVTYTTYSHPGGFAPKFISDGVIRKVSFDSLRGLRRMAAEPGYSQAAGQGELKKAIDEAVAQGRLTFKAASAARP